jgi:ribosome-associated translation inhibitor RaiA
MTNLIVKNLKEVDADLHKEITSIIEEKKAFFDDLFKKYDKNLTFEVIFDHSSDLYKVTASIDLMSKKILSIEEDKDVLKAVRTLMSKFKTAVKKQYELERKEYEFKRKR